MLYLSAPCLSVGRRLFGESNQSLHIGRFFFQILVWFLIQNPFFDKSEIGYSSTILYIYCSLWIVLTNLHRSPHENQRIAKLRSAVGTYKTSEKSSLPITLFNALFFNQSFYGDDRTGRI